MISAALCAVRQFGAIVADVWFGLMEELTVAVFRVFSFVAVVVINAAVRS